MSAAYKRSRRRSNPRSATRCGRSRNGLRPSVAVMQVARGLFPHKAAAELSVRSGYAVRTCEYWLSGASEPTGDALLALLRSDIGGELLAALMDDARAAWWGELRRQLRLTDLRRMHERSRRLLEQLEREAGEAGA